MARIRAADVRLRRGLQTVRFAAEAPGLFAVSRKIEGQPGEALIVYNTSTAAISANIEVDAASAVWTASHGACPSAPTAPASLAVSVPALDYVICVSEGAR